MTKKIVLAGYAATLLALPQLVHAEFKGGFADIGLHYLDWTSDTTRKTSNKSHKDDFGYLEIEGGANFSWGELYGFLTGRISITVAIRNQAVSSDIRLKIPTVFI